MKIQYQWDEDSGRALCLLEASNQCYIGTATCAEVDQDMKSEKTGCEIAYHRALINYFKHSKEQIKSELSGLNKYYYTINQSKYFNQNSYENKMLQHQIKIREQDLADISIEIRNEQIYLKDYITRKAEFYDKLRKKREAELNK